MLFKNKKETQIKFSEQLTIFKMSEFIDYQKEKINNFDFSKYEQEEDLKDYINSRIYFLNKIRDHVCYSGKEGKIYLTEIANCRINIFKESGENYLNFSDHKEIWIELELKIIGATLKETLPNHNPIIHYDKEETFKAMEEFISYQEESIRNFDWTRCGKYEKDAKRRIRVVLTDIKASAHRFFSKKEATLNEIILEGAHINKNFYNDNSSYLSFGKKQNWIEENLEGMAIEIQPIKPEEDLSEGQKHVVRIDVADSILNIDKHIEDTKEKYKDFDWDSYQIYFSSGESSGESKKYYQYYLDDLHKIKTSILQGEEIDCLPNFSFVDKDPCINFSISYYGRVIELLYLRNPVFSFDTIVEDYFVKKDK